MVAYAVMRSAMARFIFRKTTSEKAREKLIHALYSKGARQFSEYFYYSVRRNPVSALSGNDEHGTFSGQSYGVDIQY